MLKKILQKNLGGKKFLADKLYDVIWLREYLERRGIRVLIRVRKYRYDVDDEECKQRDEIEGLFGNVKGKLGGYGLQ